METRHEDNDGSDIFWPGYVDATTNLILNLLFLLTILIVAVFMFALELGRSSPKQGAAEKPPIVAAKLAAEAVIDPVQENIALKHEIARLKKMLGQKAPAGGLVKTVAATVNAPKARNGVDKTLASDFEIEVRFTDEAIAFTPAEHDRLRELLRPIVAKGRANVLVEVPAGFSEAKRMGYYRALAVRNLLIEMELPAENIEMLVVEGKTNANASLVRVGAR
jgi:hypothetical protein